MPRQLHHFPPLPAIGMPENHYAALAKQADRSGNLFGKEAAKVGQYVTLALDAHIDWPSKRRYFEHALRRHCVPPALPDEEVWLFYRSLSDLVRKHAGLEALKLASAEDDHLAFLAKSGVPRQNVVAKADAFFNALLGLNGQRAEWCLEDDWVQLKIMRSQWF